MMMEKYSYMVNIVSGVATISLTRNVDYKKKTYTIKRCYNEDALKSLNSFMDSLTDQQCQDMFKGVK